MSHKAESFPKYFLVLLLALSPWCVQTVAAQSLDPAAPAPIRTNSLEGRIAARDLGDSRLTDHYYAFTGTPGDLTITVQANNLNGDIDVFTAGTLRPLLKLTLYAERSTPVTKGIYLRRREDLVLRIEARSPNDDAGTYQFSFSGSFEPIQGGPDIADAGTNPTTVPSITSGGKKTRRVSSVGARIEEPPAEVAAAPTPEPTPQPTPEPKPAEPAVTETPKSTTPTTPVARTSRGRRPAIKRTTPPATPPVATDDKEKTEDKEKSAPPTETAAATETPAETPKPKTPLPTPRRKSTSRAVKPAEPVATEPPADTGPRLVIETNDGTMINRSMSGVRRVMVENGQVVVVGKDGKVDRFLLSSIVKMSIAP